MCRLRGVVALVAVLPIAGLAGCGQGPATGGDAAAAPTAGLAASVSQFREDEVRGQVRVRLTSSVPVRVATLRLEWPGLPGIPATAPDYPLAPGVPVDLPVPLVPAACGDPPTADSALPPTDPGQVTAVVGVAAPSGEVTEERVPVAAAGPTLARVYASACRAQALDSLVGVGFGDRWRPTLVRGLPALLGEVTVTRRAAVGPVTIEAVDGSVLLAVEPRPAGALPATLATGSAALSVPVTVTTSGRCDGHALGESKQTYVVDVTVDVGGAGGLVGPEPISISVPEDQRPLVWDTMLRACDALEDSG